MRNFTYRNIYIPNDSDAELRRLSEYSGKSISSTVREALDLYLKVSPEKWSQLKKLAGVCGAEFADVMDGLVTGQINTIQDSPAIKEFQAAIRLRNSNGRGHGGSGSAAQVAIN